LATQIDLLAALQDIDQRLQEKEHELQESRQQVTAIALQMAAKEREVEEQQQRIHELEIRHRAVEGQLREEEGKIKEKRVRLNRIRNERELLAMRREIEMMKEANGKLEDDALMLLEQIEQEKARLSQTRTEIDTLKARIAQETGQLEARIATLEDEVQREREAREKIAREVDADLCARYERIFARRGGLAVVEVRAGTCWGCHMHLPPHMSNQIRSNHEQNTGAIFHCPHCGRILYWRTASGSAVDA
jgi:predicted  nucleic acid-binding Zn-ribbon protein